MTGYHHHHLNDHYRPAIGKHDDAILARRVSSSEGANALILMEKCCHV